MILTLNPVSHLMKCHSLGLIFVLITMSLTECIRAQSRCMDADPFTVWKDRLVYRNLKQLSVTQSSIDNAIHDYGQDSSRLWGIFRKVLEGNCIKMIVIGGSNSAGGGISDHRQLFHQLFLQWWNRVVLPCTGSKLIMNNLSLGGTGSDFFSLCLQNYLSQMKDPDLVLIELSVNDYGYLYGRAAEPMEQLTRRVLSLSSKPFVIFVALVDLIEKVKWWRDIPNPGCLNLEDLGQLEIARHYNLTVLSWRDIVCPMDNGSSKRRIEIRSNMINDDHFHIGVKSHVQVAIMLVRHFKKVLRRDLSPLKSKLKRAKSVKKIVPLFMNKTIQGKPQCWSLLSTNWRKPDFTQSLDVTVLGHAGFREITPQSPCAKAANSGDRTDSFGGWLSENKGLIAFSFFLPNLSKNSSNNRSIGLVLRHLQWGSVRAWLGESEENAVTITGKSYGRIGLQTRIYFLGENIRSGMRHKITIKTNAGKGRFKVVVSGIVVGPVGMKDIRQYKPANTLQKVWSLEDYRKLVVDQ